MIEKRMVRSFQGSGLNLANVGQFVFKEYIDKALAKSPEKRIRSCSCPRFGRGRARPLRRTTWPTSGP
jgi:hypothetical protein